MKLSEMSKFKLNGKGKAKISTASDTWYILRKVKSLHGSASIIRHPKKCTKQMSTILSGIIFQTERKKLVFKFRFRQSCAAEN